MKTALLLLTLLLLLITGSCKQVDFVAPEGATLRLSAQPAAVDINGTATLTVTGTRANGAPLPDGTVVRFEVSDDIPPPQTGPMAGVSFAEGQVTPNPVELQDGIAQATFIAGSTSGDVTVTAISGNADPDEETITIGDARVSNVVLTAEPSGLPPGGGRVRLRAFVFDAEGNPVSGVRVFFQTTAGTLSSGGNPIRTNANGVAIDNLTTTADATVSVETSAGEDVDEVEITVGAQGAAPECGAIVSPSGSVEVGQTVFFFDASTDADSTIVESQWDFGDGGSATGENVSHVYRLPGTYLVVHRVSDSQGFSDTCDPVTVTVVDPDQTQTLSTISGY